MRLGEGIAVRALILLAILPALPATVRGLRESGLRAAALIDLAPEERKRVALGQPFVIASELEARLPENAPIDFVMMTPQSRELAQFTGANLGSHPCRYFDGEEAWRQRRRAVWMQDERGANAPPSPPPGPAAAVVFVDTRQDPQIRILR